MVENMGLAGQIEKTGENSKLYLISKIISLLIVLLHFNI